MDIGIAGNKKAPGKDERARRPVHSQSAGAEAPFDQYPFFSSIKNSLTFQHGVIQIVKLYKRVMAVSLGFCYCKHD